MYRVNCLWHCLICLIAIRLEKHSKRMANWAGEAYWRHLDLAWTEKRKEKNLEVG